MNHAYNISGGAPVVKKYRVASGSSTNQVAGGYVTVATSGVTGVVLGITQSLMSMASIVTPIVGGLLIERHLLKEWAWAAAGLAAVGVALSREGLPFYATASVDSIGAP